MKRKSEAHFHAEKKPNGCSPKRLLQRKENLTGVPKKKSSSRSLPSIFQYKLFETSPLTAERVFKFCLCEILVQKYIQQEKILCNDIPAEVSHARIYYIYSRDVLGLCKPILYTVKNSLLSRTRSMNTADRQTQTNKRL